MGRKAPDSRRAASSSTMAWLWVGIGKSTRWPAAQRRDEGAAGVLQPRTELGGDVDPVRREDSPRRREGALADRVEDDVVARGVAREILCGAVDHAVRAQPSHEVDVFPEADGRHDRTHLVQQLHRGGPDPSCRTVDEHGVAGLHPSGPDHAQRIVRPLGAGGGLLERTSAGSVSTEPSPVAPGAPHGRRTDPRRSRTPCHLSERRDRSHPSSTTVPANSHPRTLALGPRIP